MKSFCFTGETIVLGDYIDTDAILPARFLNIADEKTLGSHFMADLYPELAGKIKEGSILVAGKNFGCGSSREHAPLAIRGAGISCVVAESFSRIFFRNAINIGLPVLETNCVKKIKAAERIRVDCVNGLIVDESTGEEYRCQPLPEFMRNILADGGLLANLEKRLEEETE